MTDVFSPKFAKPTILRNIDPVLLVRLLKPFKGWLVEQDLILQKAGDVDDGLLERLSVALLDGTGLPAGLPELMSLIDEMSVPTLFDRMLACAHKAKLALPERVTGTDLAVRLYLKAPKLLDGLRVEVASLRPRKISRYLAMSEEIPKVPRDLKRRCTELEAALRKDFRARKRGNGTRLHVFREAHGFRLMIRRGDTLRSQAVIDEDAETRRLILRPELYDVVRYDQRHSDLLINARGQADTRAFCRLIGRHIFKNDFLFDAFDPPARYTLEPIREEGQAILTCAEFDQLEYVQLSVLDVEHPSLDHVRVRLGPDDVFTALQLVGGEIDPTALLQRAKFSFKIFGEKRVRPVFIIPPIGAIYEHDDVAEVIEEFIERRGLLLPRTESLNACSDTLFTMS